jgi:hypothetical protein
MSNKNMPASNSKIKAKNGKKPFIKKNNNNNNPK